MLEVLYPINSLFVYRIMFMCQLIIGELLFCVKLPKKKGFIWKAPLGIFLTLLFSLAFPIPTPNAFYQMMMFFLFFIFTYFAAYFLFDIDWRTLFFVLICGYTTEHIAYEIYSSLNNFFVAGDFNPGGIYDYDNLGLFSNNLDIVFYFVSFINIYWFAYIIFARRVTPQINFEKRNDWIIFLLGAVFLVIDIVLNSAISYYSGIHFERIYLGVIALVNALCCFLTLLFIFELSYSNSLKKENEIINELRNEERKQYTISKETIDLINIKCHDFRHQIRELGKKQNINEEAINDINKLITIYDQSIKTNNNALDTILTEKTFICSKYQIKLTTLVDGKLLDFMKEEDIYSLFGNLLDNAIESVNKIKGDKNITLKIKSVGNLISISCKNPYSGKIKFFNGLPISTKEDSNYHGFGVKSIKLIAEKYGGSLQIDASNNIFIVSILFVRNES